MPLQPSASYSLTIRCQIPQRPAAFATVVSAIGEAGGMLGAIDLVRVESGSVIRDVTVACADAGHGEEIVGRIRALPGIEVVSVSDRTFLMHRGGKIEVTPKIAITSRDDLSMVYTPGVARICRAIAEDPAKAWALTIKRNTVAVVSDGTAVLGLGDIGPEAAMPVMEGKAMLFKEFAGVDAWPICLDTKDTEEIIAVVRAIAPGFGGINLEDIAAPRCFEIERRLRAELDIPVFHDDQHGTAIVVMAALENALRVVGKRAEDVRIVMTGAGAAGTACADIMLARGIRKIVVCDLEGAVYVGRPGMNDALCGLASRTNPGGLHGTADELLAGADVFIGVSGGTVPEPAIASMAEGAFVFAMANPNPEVHPEIAHKYAAVVATGRSDFPNQINNVLAFPGIFAGALQVRASRITEAMKIAAAEALAAVVGDDLAADYVIPSPFDERVAPAVTAAVAAAARAEGVARR
jgi:malate dehydrogenase (oxaloacetate-decarboxylating)